MTSYNTNPKRCLSRGFLGGKQIIYSKVVTSNFLSIKLRFFHFFGGVVISRTANVNFDPTKNQRINESWGRVNDSTRWFNSGPNYIPDRWVARETRLRRHQFGEKVKSPSQQKSQRIARYRFNSYLGISCFLGTLRKSRDLQWRGLNLYSRGPGPRNNFFWGVRILRANYSSKKRQKLSGEIFNVFHPSQVVILHGPVLGIENHQGLLSLICETTRHYFWILFFQQWWKWKMDEPWPEVGN